MAGVRERAIQAQVGSTLEPRRGRVETMTEVGDEVMTDNQMPIIPVHHECYGHARASSKDLERVQKLQLKPWRSKQWSVRVATFDEVKRRGQQNRPKCTKHIVR